MSEKIVIERYLDRETLGLEIVFLDKRGVMLTGELARKIALSADNSGGYSSRQAGIEDYKMQGFLNGVIIKLGFVPSFRKSYFKYNNVISPENEIAIGFGSLEPDEDRNYYERVMEAVGDSFKLPFSKWDKLGRPLTLKFQEEHVYYVEKEEGK
jgi:hypothetical protein